MGTTVLTAVLEPHTLIFLYAALELCNFNNFNYKISFYSLRAIYTLCIFALSHYFTLLTLV